MVENIIETKELVYKYPDGTKALNGITLAVENGKKVAVLGPNGAGKSTLFLHFNGILRPEKGKIAFEGKEFHYDHRSLKSLRSKIGIVFQDPDSQIFSSNVLQEVSFGPVNLGLSRDEVIERVEFALEATGISELKERPVHFLSHGQKKRVAIAGILAMRPRLMVLDEPTAGLDPMLTVQMMELFYNLNRQGVTLLLSTHDVDLAYSWADYIFIIKSGELLGKGSPEEIFQNKKLVEKSDLTVPWVLSVYNVLKEKGWLNKTSPVPKTSKELFEQVKEAPCVNDFL